MLTRKEFAVCDECGAEEVVSLDWDKWDTISSVYRNRMKERGWTKRKVEAVPFGKNGHFKHINLDICPRCRGL